MGIFLLFVGVSFVQLMMSVTSRLIRYTAVIPGESGRHRSADHDGLPARECGFMVNERNVAELGVPASRRQPTRRIRGAVVRRHPRHRRGRARAEG
jgi:hypothetical protein